ncbi:hypothetical protein [Spirosoma foliorum]|uniref:Uncharacterized protein n=1 Tax=Spirosoma foliorum TaxID=2710596 RepID=A0A7G5GS50_9BACT|nr:hypothetical protein [Spirosoma foliorum]QMW01692.1 hypothetical protein H3H32_27630 [Spirosoma foliorum]
MKNMYYRTVFKRTNTIKELFLSFFLAFFSWPRLLLEVFIRKNFGERYFSFSGAVMLLIILAFLPLFFIDALGRRHGGSTLMPFIGMFLTWYVYLAGFWYMSVLRRNEIRRLPSVFDFARFSKSTGTIHPRFLSYTFRGNHFTIRGIETRLEPGFFFLIGSLLWALQQPLGALLTVCSVFYALSYRAAYYQGDQFIMDKIDEMICNEELTKSLVEGRDSSETRGFNFYGRRPVDPDSRQRIADLVMQKEEMVEAF